MLNGGNIMKNHILLKIIIFILILFFLSIVIIPVIKWNINYSVPEGLSVKETIEYYFEALDNNNPKKANQMFTDENSVQGFGMYDTYWYKSIKVNKLNIINEDSYKSIVSVDLKTKEWIDGSSNKNMWYSNSIVELVKVDGNWRISSIYSDT